MQNLNRLLQLARATAVLGDLTRERTVHTLPATPHTTVYIHAADAALRITRWERDQVEANVEVRPPLGWRLQTDYDNNGVYIVMLKRRGFGNLASATVNLVVPRQAYLVCRLENGLVSLDHIRGTLHIPPVVSDDTPPLLGTGTAPIDN